MYTILLSLLLGLLVGVGFRLGFDTSILGSLLWGLLFAVLGYGIAAWRLRGALTRRMAAIQTLMEQGQKKLQQQIQRLQVRSGGNPKQLLQEAEKLQNALIGEALDATATLEPFRGWVPLMSRQIATMRMQFHYQRKEFDKVDELLPRCLIMDPMGMAMRLAQMYRRKTPLETIRKAFDRNIARIKYNQGALLYSLMAWIYLREKQEDEAYKVLVEGVRQTDNETVKRNRDLLANQRAREFSNVGLAESWYALHLEQPKITMKRQAPRAHGRPF